MTEVFEPPATEPSDVGRYVDIARRRHLPFLIALFVVWAIVWGSSWFLPARYKSATLILVEQPTMPKNYVVPNVNDDLQDRLTSITQQILSRTRLLLIINHLNLYNHKSHHQLTPDDKVDLMRKDIDIELVKDPRENTISAFRVSYSAPNPRTAQRVTSELTNLFINENLKVRQQESEDTTHFIEDQLESARASLAEQEQKIRDFEKGHEGELPSQQATNLQILSGLQGQLQNEQDALNAARQQRVYYQSLIDQYRAAESTPGSPLAPGGLPAIDQDLERMRAQLADLSAHYTDQYPDIQKLKRQIARTEKLRQSIAANPGSAVSAPKAVATSPQGAPQLQLQSQLQAVQLEIANRESSVNALKARINQYQSRLNAVPSSEQQLADLTRGYDQSKANYDDLLKKESESQMATSMEEMQQGQRFTVLDPPSLPIKPDFPNRLKMCAMGLGAGLALGALIVGLLEFLDDRLHSDRDITKLLPVVVVAEIPEIEHVSDLQKKKTRARMGWAVAVAVIVIIAAGTVFSYLHA